MGQWRLWVGGAAWTLEDLRGGEEILNHFHPSSHTPGGSGLFGRIEATTPACEKGQVLSILLASSFRREGFNPEFSPAAVKLSEVPGARIWLIFFFKK